MARGDLTDEQWALLEPLLPVRKKVGRPATWTRRQLIDGIRFRIRTGVPWREVPARYGPWGRVYDLFRRWQRDGTWQRVSVQLQARAEAKDVIAWDLSVDADVDRARRRTVRERNRARSDRPPRGVLAEPDDRGPGGSRTGPTVRSLERLPRDPGTVLVALRPSSSTADTRAAGTPGEPPVPW